MDEDDVPFASLDCFCYPLYLDLSYLRLKTVSIGLYSISSLSNSKEKDETRVPKSAVERMSREVEIVVFGCWNE